MVCDLDMSVELSTPDVDGLSEVLGALRAWQLEGAPMQLHPGDLGWNYRFGAQATADAVRIWNRDGEIVAVGFIDVPGLLRMTIAPELRRDAELGESLVADITRPERGILGAGEAYVEAPADALVKELLRDVGWDDDEPWTPLRCDLGVPVPDPGLRIEVVGPDDAEVRVAVQRGAFDNSTFTVERWRAMTAGPAYADARCLVGYDAQGQGVATVTVWSAGPGRPGLLEPMGVHRDHRGHGYGRAITVAAAAMLQQLGASSALVATPSSNDAGVATYASAGYERRPEIRDLTRRA